ncbi:MAG: hypothetical protein AAF436_08585 [Myxococcota bacterium]
MDPENPNDPPQTPDLGAGPAPADPASAPAAPAVSDRGFALTRDSVTIGSALSTATEVWQRDVGTWALAQFLVFLIGFGIPTALGAILGISEVMLGGEELSRVTKAILDGLGFGVQFLQTILQGVLIMGFTAMGFRALHGEPARVGMIFSQVQKALKYFLQLVAIWIPMGLTMAVVGVLVWLLSVGSVDVDMPLEEAMTLLLPSLWVLALILLPIFIFVFMGILFAASELTYNDRSGPIESIVSSWRITRGHRWQVLGASFLAGIIAVASFLLCGVGILFGGPLSALILGALYLALRDGADVPEADTTSTLGG